MNCILFIASGSYVMSKDIQFFEEKEEALFMLKNIVWISELTFFIDISECEMNLYASDGSDTIYLLY